MLGLRFEPLMLFGWLSARIDSQRLMPAARDRKLNGSERKTEARLFETRIPRCPGQCVPISNKIFLSGGSQCIETDSIKGNFSNFPRIIHGYSQFDIDCPPNPPSGCISASLFSPCPLSTRTINSCGTVSGSPGFLRRISR